MQNINDKKSSVFSGFIGAFIGAVVGTVAWILVGRLNYISSAVGLLTAVLSAKLYDAFGGRQGAPKVLVLIICVLIAVLAGNLGTVYWQAYDLYKEDVAAYGKAVVHRAYGVKNSLGYFFALMGESENLGILVKNTLMGLVFAAIGCYGVIVNSAKTRKAQETYERETAARQQMSNIDNDIYGQNPNTMPTRTDSTYYAEYPNNKDN